MTVATQLNRRHFSALEEVAENSQKSHDKATIALDDIEAMGEEYVRSWKMFKQNYDRTKASLFRGEISDLNGAGKRVLETIEAARKAADAVAEILAAAHDQGRTVQCEADFVQARKDLAALKGKVLAKWPFIDYNAIRERTEHKRGAYLSSEELLNASQSKSP
jgi:hypothetical protein